LGEKSGFENKPETEKKPLENKEGENKIVSINKNNKKIKGIDLLKRADKSFSEKDFKNGVDNAFNIIVKAFSQSDIDTLRKLLSYDLLKNFTKAITERTARNEIHETKIASVDKIEIIDVKLQENIANITVVITSNQSSSIKKVDGSLIEGNNDIFEKIKDKWCFEKDISISDPIWKLVETDSAE
jgi:predicted lipid-binding transport protein (Tim44 family)